jgi:hypothetical protein
VAPAALTDATGLPPERVLPFPTIVLTAEDAARVRLGQRLALPLSGPSTLLGPEGSLVAVADVEEGRMRLLRVWGRD